MLKFCLRLFIIFSLLFSSLVFSKQETYTLDPQHTYILWRINHLGFSTQAGKWYAQGTLLLDQQNPKNSKVNATIHIADIVTGLPELDKHLKGVLFFDAEKFPDASFVSNKMVVTGKNKALIYGTLTLRGISKPITLHVVLNKIGENPVTNKMSAGFSATTTLKRSDFGINGFLPVLGDLVKIDIEAEGTK